jgi:BirA family biotin operon repressor/biotin-[acetyl-CoA-carboxylase] ligase
MQIVAHEPKVLVVGTDAPRAPLDRKLLVGEISQYWRVSVVEVTESTQKDLLEKVESGVALGGEVIAAEYQSAGRGRLDRTFTAAPHSALTFSVYVQPKIEREEWSFLTLIAGVSVREALASLDPSVSVGVKWPNDLLINEKKCAGMIAQATSKGVVLGIGINVGMTEEELPVEGATSLALESFSVLDRNVILSTILNHLEINITMWELGKTFIPEYKDASVTIGKNVEVTLPGGEVIASQATGISNSGALLLADGREVSVGDVVHLR